MIRHPGGGGGSSRPRPIRVNVNLSNAVSASDLSQGALSSSDLSGGAVSSSDLSPGAVTASDLQSGRPINLRPKTFTDAAGNVREVGTGRIIRHAPRRPSSGGSRPSGGSSGPSRPASSGGGAPHRVVTRNGVQSSSSGFKGPRTFKDAQGNVRRTAAWAAHLKGQGGAGGAAGGAAAKDPLTSIVDEIIAGMNAPLDEGRRLLDEQTRGNINQSNRIGQFYNKQLNSLQQTAGADLGAMLQRAAEAKGISAETIAANQEWLMSLMGPGSNQQAAAQASGQATAQDLAGLNDQMTREIAGGGQRLDDFLTSSRAAGHAATAEFALQEGLRRDAAIREIDAQKRANAAKAPQLRREIEAEEREFALKQAVAEREWGLKAAQFESLNNYRAGQLELGYDRLEAQSRPKPATPDKPGRYGNIPARYDTAIQKVYDRLNRPDDPKTEDVDESRVVKPWRTAFDELTKSAGLQPTTAAFLATKWYPESITSSTPFGIMAMLGNRGVNAAAQKRIVDQFFGEGTYNKVKTNPAAFLGSMAGDIL